jgi:hypothetical protein
VSDPTPIHLDLILGPSERYIAEQGEGAEAALVDYSLPASKGVRRSVVFHDCKARSNDIDLGGEIFDVWITEQSLDARPYSETWKLGGITTSPLQAHLYLLPMLFQQFWEMADAPTNGGVVHVEAHRESAILFVFGISMEVRPRQHPVVVASDKRWRELAQIARIAAIWLVAGAVAIGLIYWIVGHGT